MHTDNHTNTDKSSKSHLHLNHSKAFYVFCLFLLFFCYRRPLLIKRKEKETSRPTPEHRSLSRPWARRLSSTVASQNPAAGGAVPTRALDSEEAKGSAGGPPPPPHSPAGRQSKAQLIHLSLLCLGPVPPPQEAAGCLRGWERCRTGSWIPAAVLTDHPLLLVHPAAAPHQPSQDEHKPSPARGTRWSEGPRPRRDVWLAGDWGVTGLPCSRCPDELPPAPGLPHRDLIPELCFLGHPVSDWAHTRAGRGLGGSCPAAPTALTGPG